MATALPHALSVRHLAVPTKTSRLLGDYRSDPWRRAGCFPWGSAHMHEAVLLQMH